MLLFVLAAIAIADDDSASDVLELDTENFEEEIEGKPIILVEFYAPWWGLKHLDHDAWDLGLAGGVGYCDVERVTDYWGYHLAQAAK